MHPVDTLLLSNAYNAGKWGAIRICPPDSYVQGFELKFARVGWIGDIDDTALNGVKLYCAHYLTGVAVAYVTSSVAPAGEWQGIRPCSGGRVMTGFRGRVLEHQVLGDNVAVEDLQADCGFGEEVLEGMVGQDNLKGTWSSWARCPSNSAVCGVQTKVDAPSLLGDDTAITDVNLFCCLRNNVH